jgi:hypothetical protein
VHTNNSDCHFLTTTALLWNQVELGKTDRQAFWKILAEKIAK